MAQEETGKDDPLQVLIAGASVGGLATAIALRAQGHHVKVRLRASWSVDILSYTFQVYEQALIPDTVGGGITIFPNALEALQMLGIDTALR